MAELLTNDTDLTSVANAIRTKGGTSGNLTFPSGFVSAIGAIAADCNAAAADIRAGKTAYVGNNKVTGTATEKAAASYPVSSSDQTIAAGQILTGAQTIKKVTTANIAENNIKAGVTVKVGDVDDDDRITGVTGTFTADANAAAGDIVSGKSAYVNGEKVNGSIQSVAATTYNTSSSDQSIAAGKYLSGKQTIKAVKTTNITAANIKRGVTVKVGDANNAGRIINLEGTCQPVNTWISQSDSCYCPYMWKCSYNGNVPGFYYTDGDDSGSAAQKSKGFHCTTYEDGRKFRVPCPVKMTYYSADNSSSTGNVTFAVGSDYTVTRVNGLKHTITGTGVNISVWKIVKWELV